MNCVRKRQQKERELLCLILFAYRVWTEWETLQVFYALEKQSREWPLANNFVRDRRNAIFTETTLGAYTLVCAGLLIGHLTGELNNARITIGQALSTFGLRILAPISKKAGQCTRGCATLYRRKNYLLKHII
ncbi:hypothetical protein LSTR_LSTR016628 [Laodelphax striatellus]|uniref:Uncharacterized protein n=1 Tax=Laodelphax striatellus TaxID=195883 RepID=A0A482WM91_LAOST|nr:hypothetical protein LSTR_LSTR016628 [Laodelphax striatellus]